MFIYNTLARKKEEFVPINPDGKTVGMYVCGPTVYWYQHIGNLRSYIFADVLRRTLEYFGYDVKHIMNITDVGHLTSDEDEGEDKIEKAAKKENKTAKEIADYYLNIFKNDFKKLNILSPSIWCRATEHIEEQINLIKKLEEKSFTYKTSDGIYFDTSKLSDYGKLSGQKLEDLQAGKRIEMKEKKNTTDFALWKFSEKPGQRQQEWESPWGLGFPGWHIECSAMSIKYLGKQFDIHTGGIDHISIHHTNEIAQSEAATGDIPAKYWMHGNFLVFKGKKVSKSKGGLYTISELEKQGFNPLSFRYFTLSAHYRNPLDFSLDNLQNAQNAYSRLKNIIPDLKDDKKTNEFYLNKFKAAVSDDLDMPKTIAILWDLLRNQEAEGKYQTTKQMDKVLGLDLFKKENLEIPQEILDLLNQRGKAREEKNWKESDRIRDEIEKLGFIVEDAKEEQIIKRKCQ